VFNNLSGHGGLRHPDRPATTYQLPTSHPWSRRKPSGKFVKPILYEFINLIDQKYDRGIIFLQNTEVLTYLVEIE
jgi:hypothetical protein